MRFAHECVKAIPQHWFTEDKSDDEIVDAEDATSKSNTVDTSNIISVELPNENLNVSYIIFKNKKINYDR